MPCKTERQQTADALHMAFLAQLIAESEASFDQDNGSDSELDMDPSGAVSPARDTTLQQAQGECLLDSLL